MEENKIETFQNVLMKIGIFAGENKYLSSIKNAFQTFMPFIIIGAIGVLWSNVICNDQTGLGAIFPAVMNLSIFKSSL